jgi:hypothetical protein
MNTCRRCGAADEWLEVVTWTLLDLFGSEQTEMTSVLCTLCGNSESRPLVAA